MKLTTKNKDAKNYIEATAILHKIGNQKPYFSLTGRVVEKGLESYSGAIHDEILKAFPQLADIAALHLSDIDGKPMHSFENGKYWAGFTKWEDGNIKHLSQLWRISEKSAEKLSYDALNTQCQEIEVETGEIVLEETLLKEFHDRQIPRWKQEADAVIKKHALELVAR
jgi:hypothetical protein